MTQEQEHDQEQFIKSIICEKSEFPKFCPNSNTDKTFLCNGKKFELGKKKQKRHI